jgi:hypothetical protein
MTALLHAPSRERRTVRSLWIRLFAAATVWCTVPNDASHGRPCAGCESRARQRPVTLNLRPKD